MKERRKPKAGPPTGDRQGTHILGIEVLNRQRKVAVDVDRLRKAATFVVRQFGLSGSELNVVLLSDRAIRRLNARYLGRPGPTDVLAFSQREGVGPGPENRMLGDVVIGVETALRQASERRAPLNAELDLLLVHGVLHLVGYDHVRSQSQRLRMRRAEARMLRSLHREVPP